MLSPDPRFAPLSLFVFRAKVHRFCCAVETCPLLKVIVPWVAVLGRLLTIKLLLVFRVVRF